jgi:hypothetical protein
MASSSVIGAVIERVGGFGFPADVTVWFDQAPLKDTSGIAVVPPYLVLHDDGFSPEFDFEYNPVFDPWAIRFEVYGLTLASVDAIVNVVKYNGGSLTNQQGMDFADSLPLTGSVLKESLRTNERRFQEAMRDGSAQLVFRCTLTYRVTTQRTSA